MLIIQSLMKLLQILNSQTSPSQLAAGVAFGMIIGLGPFFVWHNLIVFLLVCLFRVNLSMFFWSILVFSVVGFVFDPLFDSIGYWVLVDWSFARPLWIWVSSAPILPFFRLNNTIVMGSLAFSLCMFGPIFFLATYAVKKYRTHWRALILNSRYFGILKTTKLYSFYLKYEAAKEKWSQFI